MRAAPLLALAALASGCVPGDGGDSGPSGSPVEPCEMPLDIAIGWGEYAYVPLEDGGEATMVHGLQGGWHIDLAVSLTGSTPKVSSAPGIVLLDEGLQIAGADQEPD